MAQAAMERTPASIGIAITGVGGPKPDEDGNPVGLVCIAVAREDKVLFSIERNYGNIGRDRVRRRAVADALGQLSLMAQGD
jgi:nicotinamide-nucleotide amidase